jgi:phosphatidylinositol 3-kinase
LDNILLTNDGKLFHVDYGFFLGKDPKPLTPAVRLTREMIEGFGGLESNGYQSYLKHCTEAFCIIRRYAPLLLNIFALVCDSGLPGIDSSREAIGFLYTRLRLDLDEDEATEFITRTINESCNLLFPQLMERVHKAAQRNRK